MIKINGLSKEYKDLKAIDNITFSLKKGEICGLVGRNGAGKTTLMKILAGLSKKTKGSIEFLEQTEKNIDYSKIGSLIENPCFFMGMTAYDNLLLKSILLGVENKDKEINYLLDLVNLLPYKRKKIKEYSLGMKQRLGIAMALIGKPNFLILDEPINGLDPVGIVEIRNALLRLRKEKNVTILISSHILPELSMLVDRYIIIDKGTMINDLSSDELDEICSDKKISLEDYYFEIVGGISHD